MKGRMRSSLGALYVCANGYVVGIFSAAPTRPDNLPIGHLLVHQSNAQQTGPLSNTKGSSTEVGYMSKSETS